jgi:signal transduction histidine kinase
LRAVQGFASALAEDYGSRLDGTGREYTERVSLAAQRMDALIQDLLEYSRIGRAELHLAAVPLGEVTAHALEKLAGEIERAGASIAVKDPLPHARAHHATLEKVLLNLLGNALKFTRRGVPPEIEIWAEASGGKARLCVRDNGIGIAPQHFERVFRVFERLHGAEAYPGTGIGLAIVKKGVERMGGRVGVESQAGAGSCFWIELNLASHSGHADAL